MRIRVVQNSSMPPILLRQEHGNWGMQSIIGTIAKIRENYAIVNDENTDEATADKHMAIVYKKEDKLCQILEQLKRRGEKPDDDERLAIFELILDPHDPPEFADTFKKQLLTAVVARSCTHAAPSAWDSPPASAGVVALVRHMKGRP